MANISGGLNKNKNDLLHFIFPSAAIFLIGGFVNQ